MCAALHCHWPGIWGIERVRNPNLPEQIICIRNRDFHPFELTWIREALSICQKNLAQIDLVVTDLVMPRMTGLQLKEKIVALCPSMKFLLISGYAEDVVGSLEGIADAVDFLEKPFHRHELVRRVREILSQGSGTQEESSGGNTLPELPPDKSDSGANHG